MYIVLFLIAVAILGFAVVRTSQHERSEQKRYQDKVKKAKK